MHISKLRDWPIAPFGALGKGTVVVWPYTEPSRGVYDWTNLDQWVAAAQKRGVSFFFSNDGMPMWAVNDISTCKPAYQGAATLKCRSMVANIQDWDNYITALVTRYKGKMIYELWNEPSANHSLTVADMVTLVTHEYNIIRALDPEATIVCCAFTHPNNFGYMEKFFAAGGPRGVDVYSFHGIFGLPVQPPEWISGQIDIVRQILISNGLGDKPLWDTEGGWSVASPPVTDDRVAFVAKWFLLHASKGVSRAYWYNWESYRPLWDAEHGLNAVGVSYTQVYDWLRGAEISAPCSGVGADIWTCGLTRPNGYQAQVVWSSSGTTVYVPGGQYAQYRDLAGNTFALEPGSYLSVGTAPILLENFTP